MLKQRTLNWAWVYACGCMRRKASITSKRSKVGRRLSAQSIARAAGPSAGQGDPDSCWRALQAAWTPFAAAWRAPWWECVAVPEDVTDADGFRQGEQAISWLMIAACRTAAPCPRPHDKQEHRSEACEQPRTSTCMSVTRG